VKALSFDLDGTLLDTLDDIAAALNDSLTAMGAPTLTPEDVRVRIGHGVNYLLERSLPKAMHDRLDVFHQHFMNHYRRHLKGTTRPFEGIPELLAEMHQQGVPMAVLSNKPHPLTVDAVDHFLAPNTFAVVHGHKLDVPRKPDPTSALAIAAQIAAEPSACVFIGDSEADVGTAQAAGMVGLAVTWGFRSRHELKQAGADVIVDTVAELSEWLRENLR